MPLTSTELCRVRAVTTFTTLSANPDTWQTALAAAKKQCDSLAQSLQQRGYQVQSIRIVTNPFAEYLNISSVETAKQGLAEIKAMLLQLNQDSDLRIRFAIGEAKTSAEIALLPELIKDYGDLCNACVNIAADEYGFLDNQQISHCAEAVQKIAAITPRGEGNFNFTVNFNCQPLIPYFPQVITAASWVTVLSSVWKRRIYWRRHWRAFNPHGNNKPTPIFYNRLIRQCVMPCNIILIR
ncbi:Uncharacterised ACR [Pasteurella testudinis DSM 23072]|uniref:Uncharacterized ACR n=1 Tax=Pasteurella testudinis DSM 23072 TaxID=1122938 RepID=A0A1W1UIM3_9PAST|nr:Uncharacterised ACR [Pasteurella testudinis DSM 23072]SUB52283.1 Uncharacterized conserved protein [Pasteurella testudinis]